MRSFTLAASLATAALITGCTVPVTVGSTSAAYEVMGSKTRQGKAYVVLSENMLDLRKTIQPGQACGAWKYPVFLGDALRISIRKTMEGAFEQTVMLAPNQRGQGDAPTYIFRFEEYEPKIRFVADFTAEASAEIALSVSARDATGKEFYATTVRGNGQGSEVGNCTVGGPAISAATEKAIRVAMENFVSKVINIDWQRQAPSK